MYGRTQVEVGKLCREEGWPPLAAMRTGIKKRLMLLKVAAHHQWHGAVSHGVMDVA
jgi:hypothetical protein